MSDSLFNKLDSLPLAGLFRDEQGRLYGTTVTNGLIQFVQGGNVFEIIP